MSGSQKVPVTISVDPAQLARLDQVAEDLDRSRSWVAGRALSAFLAATDTLSPAPGFVSQVPAGPPGMGAFGRRPSPVLASTEMSMPEAPPDNTKGLHQAHLARTIEVAQQQAAAAHAGKSAALQQAADYISKIGKSE